MTMPQLRVFGFEDSTCEASYGDAHTTSRTVSSSPNLGCRGIGGGGMGDASQPNMVTLRVQDVVAALSQSMGKNLAWIDDFKDDPIVVTQDLYEVLLAFQRIRRVA